MAAYHQLGHNSEILIFEPELSGFQGAILSPVNYDPSKTAAQVARIRKERGDAFDVVLDPQLYAPKSDRGQLSKWAHFADEVDTIDLTSIAWWKKVNGKLRTQAEQLAVSGLCTPVMLPKADQFSDAYFSEVIAIGDNLFEQLQDTPIRAIQSAVVGLKELSLESRPMEVASLLSASKASEIYLVLLTDVTPRRELQSSDQLEGAVKLIRELRQSNLKVLVGFCAADMILWKAAGANSCATGNYFNLRRFTRNRFEDPSEGGKNISYFFEESLLAFLREADVRRLRARNLLSNRSLQNPYAKQILTDFQENPGKAWLAKGWREYLYWFADCEHRISSGEPVESLLKPAEDAWLRLPSEKILLEDPTNDGSWVRSWRIAAMAASAD